LGAGPSGDSTRPTSSSFTTNVRYRAAIATVVETCSVLNANCLLGGSLLHLAGRARGRRVRPGNRWMRWRGTATLIFELHPSFPLSSPRSRRTAITTTTGGPRCEPLECGTSVRIVGGRLLGPEAHSRYLVGEHRSDVSFPVTDARPWYSCRPDRGVRHRARGCAGTLEVGGFLGC